MTVRAGAEGVHSVKPGMLRTSCQPERQVEPALPGDDTAETNTHHEHDSGLLCIDRERTALSRRFDQPGEGLANLAIRALQVRVQVILTTGMPHVLSHEGVTAAWAFP
jgi:hypothetical protein